MIVLVGELLKFGVQFQQHHSHGVRQFPAEADLHEPFTFPTRRF